MKKLSKVKRERFEKIQAQISDAHNLIKANNMTVTFLINLINDLCIEAQNLSGLDESEIMALLPKVFTKPSDRPQYEEVGEDLVNKANVAIQAKKDLGFKNV